MRPSDKQMLHTYVTRPLFIKPSFWDRVLAFFGRRG